MEGQEPPQELEMGLSPVGDGVEAVALGDRGADAHKQNLVQLVRHVFGTSSVSIREKWSSKSRNRDGSAGS